MFENIHHCSIDGMAFFWTFPGASYSGSFVSDPDGVVLISSDAFDGNGRWTTQRVRWEGIKSETLSQIVDVESRAASPF